MLSQLNKVKSAALKELDGINNVKDLESWPDEEPE